MKTGKNRNENPTVTGWRYRNRLSPPRQQVPLCQRERLLRSLSLARSCKVSLLLAPAGYGKTTLLSQWVERLKQENTRVAWCKLTSRESEPAKLMRMLAQSLHASGLDMDDTGLLLDGDIYKEAALDAITLKLELGQDNIVLILDDFETIQETVSAPLVDELLELLPAHVHLVLATRRNPPLKLMLLRAQGNLRIIDPKELEFNNDEIKEFLEHCVAPNKLQQVKEWTQGWPVAIQLYRSWRERHSEDNEDDTKQPPLWPTESVTDYLAKQVFDTLTAEQQLFIAEGSLLEEIEPEAVDYMRETHNSLTTLRDLQSRLPSLVETTHIETQPVFRLHPLILRALRVLYPINPERATYLHQRASTWFLEHERQIEAIRHAVASNEMSAVVAIIGKLYPLHIFLRSGIAELKSIVRELPHSIVERELRIQLMLTLIHFKSGLYNEALTLVANLANSSANSGQKPTTQFDIEQLALNAMFRIYAGHCDQSIDQDLEKLRDLTETDPLMWAWRVNLMIVIHEQRGELLEAAKAIEQCETIYDLQGMRFASFHLMSHRLLLNLAHGYLRETASYVSKMVKRRSTEFRSDVPILSMTRLAEATIAYERRPSEAIAEVINRTLEQLGDSETWFEQRAIAAPILADIAYYHGGSKAVEEFAQSWRDWAEKIGAIHLELLLPALTARYLIFDNRLNDAETIIQQFNFSDRTVRQACLRWREREIVLSTLSLYYLSRGEFDSAETHAKQLLEDANNGARLRGAISANVLNARIKYARGDEEDALTDMLHAVRAAYSEGYVMPFAEAGHPVLPILQLLGEQSDLPTLEKQHIELIIGNFSLQPSLNPHDLNKREIEILRHLAEGASNKLIGRRIGISDNTVKYHLKSAFQKLGVNSRKAAAAAFEAEREAGYYP